MRLILQSMFENEDDFERGDPIGYRVMVDGKNKKSFSHDHYDQALGYAIAMAQAHGRKAEDYTHITHRNAVDTDREFQ